MKLTATHKRSCFLGDHPPLMKREILTSQATEQTLLAGTVIGKTETSIGIFTAALKENPIGILVEDTVIPATGGAMASLYIHAHVILSELIFGNLSSHGISTFRHCYVVV